MIFDGGGRRTEDRGQDALTDRLFTLKKIGDWGLEIRERMAFGCLRGCGTGLHRWVELLGGGVMDRSILFTSHAEENLRLREIMREEVETVIRDPRRVESGRSGGRH